MYNNTGMSVYFGWTQNVGERGPRIAAKLTIKTIHKNGVSRELAFRLVKLRYRLRIHGFFFFKQSTERSGKRKRQKLEKSTASRRSDWRKTTGGRRRDRSGWPRLSARPSLSPDPRRRRCCTSRPRRPNSTVYLEEKGSDDKNVAFFQFQQKSRYIIKESEVLCV